MKRILLLLFSLITTAAIGQYPINQILSSDSTMVSVGRNATGGIRGGLVNMVFADTTAANLSRISYYTGAQIWTTTDSAIWVRFKGTPSFWVKMAGASGGTTGSFWNITGNYFGGGVPLNYGVGTNSYDYLPFKTNNTTRLLIPPDGILRSSAPANKYLMMDTTTLEMYYGDGGGGSGWSLTGNAGTTSSNFIGTTDNQPLSFRVNNNWAGRIYTNGSVYLGDSAGVNDVQEDESNVGIGRFALKNVTVSSGNVASGESALYNLTVGFGNVAGGLETLYNLTAGSYNTAIGTSSGNNANQKVDAKNQILIGANTYGTRDSIAVIGASFMKETILRGNLIDSTLSAGAGTKAVRWNSSTGEFTYADTSEVTTPTWQQTLTAGSTLTGDNIIDGGFNSIGFEDFNGFAISVRNNSGIEFNGYNGAKRSAISVAGDSIVLKLNNSGNFYIDSLQNVSTQSVLLGGTSSINNREIGYLNIGTGLSLSSGTLNSVWTASGNDVYNNNSGNVGIGTSTPATKFHTVGTVRHQTLGTAITDTTTYKPLVINSSGDVLPSTYWYGGGGGGWSLTGNAGTNPASNFIGTTDGQPLMFRYNNQNAGSIGKEGMHTYLGIEAGENDVSGGDPNIGIGSYVLSSNTTGDGNSAVGGFALGINTTGYYNSAVGVSALYSNTTGYYNSAVGVSAFYGNTTGYYNSAVGASALGSNTTGYYNSAVGASAGYNAKQKVDAKNQILIGANTYGTRDSIAVIGASFMKETILRGNLIDSTLSAGAGTKAVRWNSSTGEFTYADTTAGNSVNLVFGGGSGASADTAVFTTSAIYGSFYNDADTIVVTSMRSVLQGTSPDVTYKVWYNDSLNVEAGATALVTAGSQVTNTTTGTNVTSFDVTKIPPGVWVWVNTSAVTTKPTYFSLTINANR